jgi:hypothetical protein
MVKESVPTHTLFNLLIGVYLLYYGSRILRIVVSFSSTYQIGAFGEFCPSTSLFNSRNMEVITYT